MHAPKIQRGGWSVGCALANNNNMAVASRYNDTLTGDESINQSILKFQPIPSPINITKKLPKRVKIVMLNLMNISISFSN